MCLTTMSALDFVSAQLTKMTARRNNGAAIIFGDFSNAEITIKSCGPRFKFARLTSTVPSVIVYVSGSDGLPVEMQVKEDIAEITFGEFSDSANSASSALKHILMLKVVGSSIVLIVDLNTWSKRPCRRMPVRLIP